MEQGQEEYVSYQERIAMMEKEEKTTFIKQEKAKSARPLAKNEQEYAEAIHRLFQIEDFKTYLEYEAREIAERMTASFEEPKEPMLKTATLGEKLAYNKGRYYQMMHVRNERTNLAKQYVNNLRNVEKEG